MYEKPANLAGCMHVLVLAGILLLATAQAGAVAITAVDIAKDDTLTERFTRHTVTGINTDLPKFRDIPGFQGASYLAVGDLDNDSVVEIICTSGIGTDLNGYSAGDGAVAVFTRNGNTLDGWKQSIINSTFAFPNEMVLRDMDADGDMDIMVLDNFIAGWHTCGRAGIYYLENGGGDITAASNWTKQTIHQGVVDGDCPCSPVGEGSCPEGLESYHRAMFMDVDGDGLEDFITTRVDMWKWQWTSQQYRWVEWFEKDGDAQPGAPGYDPTAYTRHSIGDGGGFVFNLVDVDSDQDLDIVAPQFLIQTRGTLIPKGPGDIRGDSLAWFENPGPQGDVFSPWNRYTIDNWYSSQNPLGKCFDVKPVDIDADDMPELLVTTHNHQDYKPDNNDPDRARIWPSGVYLLEIPGNQTDQTERWKPVTIDAGDPELDPDDQSAVAADPYAVDRPGGPYSQGSPGLVNAGDVNGDGYPDLVVSGDGKGAVYYYESSAIAGSVLQYRRAALYEETACMPGEVTVADVDADGDLDIISAVFDTSIDKTDPLDSSSIFVFENTGPGTDHDVPCVANLVYGHAAPEARALRSFRDRVLNRSALGRDCIRLYYALHPMIVQFIARNPAVNETVRQALDALLAISGND